MAKKKGIFEGIKDGWESFVVELKEVWFLEDEHDA